MMSEFDIIIRVLAAILLGGLIGLEREAKGHAAGLRTYMLVSLGAALFMIAAELLTLRYSGLAQVPDPSRIGSTVVTGVRFLGAGVIFQSRTRIHNLTTAAGIWVVAAIGMLAGTGFFVTAISGTVITLIVLAGLPRVEAWINRRFRTDGRGRADDNTRLPGAADADDQ
jgi:putative Mg2+ transporter-C (MgtC) family protein